MVTFPSRPRLTAPAKTDVDLPASRPNRLLHAAVLTLLLVVSPARADPIRMQCWNCLQRLAMELPAVNPQQDPSYEQGLTPGSVLPALATCSLDDSQIPDLRRIIQVFTDAQVKGGGAAYVRQQLERMPEISTDDRAKLLDGAR